MSQFRTIAATVIAGLLVSAGCTGPYRPMMYRHSDGPPADFGVPVTEGPILDNGGAFPAMPGNGLPPGAVVTPGTPAAPVGPPPPVMPPATATPPAPPLNTPPVVGPMPRLSPAAAASQPKS